VISNNGNDGIDVVAKSLVGVTINGNTIGDPINGGNKAFGIEMLSSGPVGTVLKAQVNNNVFQKNTSDALDATSQNKAEFDLGLHFNSSILNGGDYVLNNAKNATFNVEQNPGGTIPLFPPTQNSGTITFNGPGSFGQVPFGSVNPNMLP